VPLSKRKREQLTTWTIRVRLPSDIPLHRACRFLAGLLSEAGRYR
jgi:hypothetical protein